MTSSKNASYWIKTGLIGSMVAAIFCVTPILVVLLAALGLASWTGYLDYVLMPMFVIFLGSVVYGWRLKRRRAPRASEE